LPIEASNCLSLPKLGSALFIIDTPFLGDDSSGFEAIILVLLRIKKNNLQEQL
jgi:hypothetical protein